MDTKNRWAGTVLAAALIVGCGDQVTGPGGTPPPGAAAGGAAFEQVEAGRLASAPIDVSGDWEWHREEKLTIPADFAFVFGIVPEGPITHFECTIEGVMTLVQSGDALSGTEMETGSVCETRGGQVFVQPGLGVLIPIPEGRVRGRTLEITIGDAEVICPIHASIRSSNGGVAQALRGTGRCWVPGHPNANPPEGSPFDLDPPPAGTEKIVRWEAVRP